MHEETRESRRVHDGRLIKLDVYAVEGPDGATHVREVVKHPGGVAAVALDGEDVLLVRQYRIATGHSLLELPAGTREPDEDPRDTMTRELQEEIGFKPGVLIPLGGFFTAPGYSSEYLHLYLATNLIPAPLPTDEGEDIKVERMSFQTALDLIEQGEIIDNKTVNGLLRVARRLGK